MPQTLLLAIPDSRHFGGFLVGSFFFLTIFLIDGTTLVQNSKIVKEGGNAVNIKKAFFLKRITDLLVVLFDCVSLSILLIGNFALLISSE